MSAKTAFTVFLVGFVGLCGVLVIQSGLFDNPDPAHQAAIPLAGQTSPGGAIDQPQTSQPNASGEEATVYGSNYDFSSLRATDLSPATHTIGSVYADTGFKFELELTSKGAGIARATLSEFKDRDPEEPAPLVLLAPVTDKRTVYSLANNSFALVDIKAKPFPLYKLNWRLNESQSNSQKATFHATLADAAGKDAIRLTKVFSVTRDSYNIQCDVTIENLSDRQLKTKFDIQGPGGFGIESFRGDMRSVIAAFIKNDGSIDSLKIDNAKLRKFKKAGNTEDMQLRHKDPYAHFLWAAVTNKYFAAILRPVPEDNDNWPKDVRMGPAEYYDTELAAKKPGDDANNSFSVRTTDLTLAPAGTSEAIKTLGFQLYLGPKDRDIFNDTPLYKRLSYFHAIDFRSCFCCPTALIRFLAFGIMAIMNWMYAAMGPAGNYGIVIMVLVFMMRLILHPVTKKSQVSMMKMQKLGPLTEELKKKYANNKAELQKQMMKLYRDQGVSPVSSMLPMMIQMPIWISLWTAVSASVELRGASFLPFWITDLSAPDALFRFEAITIPIVGWEIDSFNLLPLLMGVVMFLQQKLMPHASSQQTNPQVAQQQKMMMIMMPLMFPIMLYKGASGVNLYILSSISAGVIEQIVIRKHIREKEAAESVGLVSATKKTGGKVKKKKPKPFFKT